MLMSSVKNSADSLRWSAESMIQDWYCQLTALLLMLEMQIGVILCDPLLSRSLNKSQRTVIEGMKFDMRDS